MIPNDEFNDDDLDSHFKNGEGPDSPNLKILPPYIFLIFLVTGLVLEVFWNINLFRWQAQLVLGLLLNGGAIMLFGWAHQVMTLRGEKISPDVPTHKIVDDGPYAYSRNPIYLACFLFYAGFSILFDVIWAGILIVPLAYVFTKYVIEPEEGYLWRKFGGEYGEYQKAVRRWI